MGRPPFGKLAGSGGEGDPTGMMDTRRDDGGTGVWVPGIRLVCGFSAESDRSSDRPISGCGGTEKGVVGTFAGMFNILKSVDSLSLTAFKSLLSASKSLMSSDSFFSASSNFLLSADISFSLACSLLKGEYSSALLI